MKKLIRIFAVIAIIFAVSPHSKFENIEKRDDDVVLTMDSENSFKAENKIKAYTYTNVCWRCGASINSNYNKKCRQCGWYICNNCGACDYDCPRCPSYKTSSGTSNSSSSKSEDNSWVWFLVIGAAVVGGIYLYKRAH